MKRIFKQTKWTYCFNILTHVTADVEIVSDFKHVEKTRFAGNRFNACTV